MATYPVEIPSENCWAVFQSTSGTMYSPTFDEELAALIFSTYYGDRRWSDLTPAVFSEEAQMALASDIQMFLDELAPRQQSVCELDRQLPLEWIKELDLDYEEEIAADPAYVSRYDEHDLRDQFHGNDWQGRQVRELVMTGLAAWRAAHPHPTAAR